ncbi:uncharacterized protein LW93_5067 [Fusarium fujikuroi]|nr:uncharacterized protein LW93_5067 [Fusarium fujikuroi]
MAPNPDVTTRAQQVLEAWSQGFNVGAVIILLLLVLCNYRKNTLLHKLILGEGPQQHCNSIIYLIFHPQPHRMAQNPSIPPKMGSPCLHHLTSHRPTLLGSRNMGQLSVSQSSRDPWWVFTTIKLVLAINGNYEFTIPGLIRTSPRFGIMLFSLFLSIVFLITDVIFMIAVSKRGGINPFWRLALVFKCASDVIFLDDFKSVLDRISESAMRKITTFEYRDHASPSINHHASVDFSSPNFQRKGSRFGSSSRAETGSILHPVGSRDDGHYEFASNYSQASVDDGAARPWLEDDARRSSSHSPRRRGESQDNMITIQEDDTTNEAGDIPIEPVRARTRNDQAR